MAKEFSELPFNSRPDLTPYLLHLTKRSKLDGKRQSAYQNLVSILRTGTIRASQASGYIKGGLSATCFMDVPFASLKYVLTPENRDPKKPRYEPYGICIKKNTAYKKGCRPVLYLSSSETKTLSIPKAELWRVVEFRVQNEKWISWLHEREWRCQGDMGLPTGPLAALVKTTEEARKLQQDIQKADEEGNRFKCIPQSILPLQLICQGLLPREE